MVLTIRTDHHSLKNLLNQVIQTSEQQYFLCKLLGYSYTIVYERGRENLAADALSRLPTEEEDDIKSEQLMALMCQPMPAWLDQLREENRSDPWLVNIYYPVRNQAAPLGFDIHDGFVIFQNRYCLGPKSTLCALVLHEFYGSQLGYYRICQQFYWAGTT